jgi:hypothetical protein
LGEAAKWAVFGSPRHDALGERGTDAGETCDVAHVGVIEVDPLAGKERAGELCGTASRLAQRTRTRR